MENLFNYDWDNSDIDEVFVDVLPVCVSVHAVLLTGVDAKHELRLVITQPSFEFDYENSDFDEVLLEWSQDLGEYDDEHELAVEIEGEYCYVGLKKGRNIISYLQIKHQLGEGIVVDLFTGDDEIIEELGYILYEDIISGSDVGTKDVA